jgi:very-short-patch-repair endonuclease
MKRRDPLPAFPQGGRRNKKTPILPSPRGEGGTVENIKISSWMRKIIKEAKQNHGAVEIVKDRARLLRKQMTTQEQKLWNKLRRGKILGKHFRRQHPYRIYILDFYCDELKLAIEADGEIHQLTEEYDIQRTRYLEKTGISVIRFDNEQIDNEIDEVMQIIKDYIINLESETPDPHSRFADSPPRGRAKQ